MNVPGVSASVGTVSAVAVDSTGNVFIAAQDYSVVLRWEAASGVLTKVAGNANYGPLGDGGQATSTALGFPSGLAVDLEGNLYIADQSNNSIRKVSATGIITTVAGTGTPGFSGDGGPATSAQINSPFGVAVDSAGNIYISDSGNNRIRKVSGGVITTVAGNGSGGFSGDNGPATSAQLIGPNAVVVDIHGNLFFGDIGNRRVREVSGGIITTVAGNGTYGFSGDGGPATSAALMSPTGIGVDSAGNVYIADSASNRIRKVSKGVITTLAGNGSSGYSGDAGPAAGAVLQNPRSVAVSADGTIQIADNLRVRQISTDGFITTIAGNGTGFGGDNGPATSAQFDGTSGVAVDSNGNVYISDVNNNRVRKVTNGVVTSVAGTGTAFPLSYPVALAIGSHGNLFIEERLFRIVEFANSRITAVAGNGTPSGSCFEIGSAADAGWGISVGIAVDTSDNVYIADGSANCIVEVSGDTATRVAGGGTAGDGGLATSAQLRSPFGVAVDPGGTLYIADSLNHRIRKVSKGIITTVAGNGLAGSGSAGDGGPATGAALGFPWGLAFDSLGNLYFTDTDRIRKVSGGIITTIAGGGTLLGDDGPATLALLAPQGIAVDKGGNVYATDSVYRVRLLSPSGASCEYSAIPETLTAAASGGIFLVAIQSSPSCAWAIQNLPEWIGLPGGVTGFGTGTVALSVAANSGAARSAHVSIAGVDVPVSQSGGKELLVSTGGVANSADYSATVAPGSIASVFGNFLLPSALSAMSLPVPSSLGGLQLQFGGAYAVPLFYAASNQVNGQVPWELAGQTQTTITATFNGQTSAPQTVNLATYAPAIFTINGAGTGPGAILDASNQIVSAANPTTAGAYIQVYCTGLGPVTNQPETGSAPSGGPSLTIARTSASMGRVPATVTFSGLTGDIGLYQVNIQVPGVTGSAVPLTISVNGVPSNIVTLAVR